MTQLVFQETQRFRQVWIWAVLLGVAGITLGSLFFLKRESPLSFTDFAIPIGMLLLVNGLFYSFTLSTRITRDRLSFRFFPFIQWRSYRFEEVESLELVAYNGLWDYGGWGIKWNGDTWSYTTGGKWGLLLKTRHKKILLGTKNPDEIKQALAHFTAFKLAEKD